jgi:FMN phosphatase YigB (HAD superfamily)/carbamoylphosphate synthase large subunit
MEQRRTYRILFTGVGRRVELMQAFRQAANNLNIDLKLYGADMVMTAPALAFCDYTRRILKVQDEEYIPNIIETCRKDSIDMVIPTIDKDLMLLSRNVEKFEEIGTKVLISKPEKIAICRDKNKTADFFEICGLNAPKTVNDYRKYDGVYPCFIKPKDGSSSINAFKVENYEELKRYAEQIGDYVVQPFIEGTEYTVDIFCNYDGTPIHITPRIRMAVRAGEVLKTKISLDKKIIEESKKLIEVFKPCGPLTVQLIRQHTTGDDYFIEINPRFGGGTPLSMKSGARSAETVLKMMLGEKVEYSQEQDDGAVYSRFDQSVRISDERVKQQVKGVVFDLDDTLYPEKQYVMSGFKAVGIHLGNEEYADRLWSYFNEGKVAIYELLKEIDSLDKETECLEIYREHIPQIILYDGVWEMIKKIKDKGLNVGIITDGRISGQKNKIKALGLDKLIDDIIITDELGGEQFRKPCDIAFRIMQRKWRIPFEQMVYVGDNADKDFQAPRQLGMQSVWFQNEDGLYRKNGLMSGTKVCVSNFNEIAEVLA